MACLATAPLSTALSESGDATRSRFANVKQRYQPKYARNDAVVVAHALS